jgi:VWFA-related protein
MTSRLPPRLCGLLLAIGLACGVAWPAAPSGQSLPTRRPPAGQAGDAPTEGQAASGATPPGTPAAGSQGAAADQPARPTFRTEANYVRIDAFVTSDGEPVRDLTREDFAVFEDGVAQRIDQFEHVEIRGGSVPRTAREPSTVAESRAAAEDPRVRVFVVFLDTYHTGVAGSHRMQRALATLLQRILAPEDLFAVMTPEMSAADITFGRRTEGLEQMLAKYWTWGRRGQIADRDPEEDAYTICYPEQQFGDLARQLIDRRRERLSLAALRDLTVYLRGVREERKAVLAVTDGWRLFRPDPALTKVGPQTQVPWVPTPGLGPGGRPTSDVDRARAGSGALPLGNCERDRIDLASVDHAFEFRELEGVANRANVSFYPIDSRGLPVFDEPIGPDQPPLVSVDQRVLASRIESLRELAANTDGLAVVNSNDIEGGLRRIADDLTSYYLLGYYSTNGTLDGKFRRIDVRVTRPGAAVRARRGYRAPTADEVGAAAASAAALAVSEETAVVQRAIAGLASVRPEVKLRTAVGWRPGVEAGARHVWAVAELDPTILRGVEWASGGVAEARLADAGGTPLATVEVPFAGGSGGPVAIDLGAAPVTAGDYVVRVRVRPAGGGLPYADTTRLVVPVAACSIGSARLLRRGPATGTSYVPSADPRFRRTERVRLEWPVRGTLADIEAQVLDRTGKPMALPVALTAREDAAAGVTWQTADLAVAPLAEGEYAVRLRGRQGEASCDALVAFRVIP